MEQVLSILRVSESVGSKELPATVVRFGLNMYHDPGRPSNSHTAREYLNNSHYLAPRKTNDLPYSSIGFPLMSGSFIRIIVIKRQKRPDLSQMFDLNVGVTSNVVVKSELFYDVFEELDLLRDGETPDNSSTKYHDRRCTTEHLWSTPDQNQTLML